MPLLNVQVRRVKYEKGLARKHKLATKFDFPLEIQFEEDLDILTDDDLEEYIAEQIEEQTGYSALSFEFEADCVDDEASVHYRYAQSDCETFDEFIEQENFPEDYR